MKLVLSAIGLLFFFSARADVIIYKQNIHLTQRQDAGTTTERYTGWTVIDLQTGQLGIVKVFDNWFSIEQPEAEMAALLGTPHRAKALGIISIKDGKFSGLIAKGINRSLPIGLSTNWTIPRTLAVSGSHLVYTNYSFPSLVPAYIEYSSLFRPSTNNFSFNRPFGKALLCEYKGALIYDRENTVQANADHLDLDATLLQFKQILLNKGYYDWDNRAILYSQSQVMQSTPRSPPPLPPLPPLE